MTPSDNRMRSCHTGYEMLKFATVIHNDSNHIQLYDHIKRPYNCQHSSLCNFEYCLVLYIAHVHGKYPH